MTYGVHSKRGSMRRGQKSGRIARWHGIGALAIGLLLAACGSDDPAAEADNGATTDTATPWLVQTDIDSVAWQTVVSGDANLGKLVAAATGSFMAAGEIEDGDGAKVTWAEYAADVDAARASVTGLFLSCDAHSVCKAGKGVYTDTGATLSDAAGGALERLAIGRPVMHKKLAKSALDSGTVLFFSLDRKHKVDAGLSKLQVDSGSFGKRRLLLMSTWGAQTGFAFAPELQSGAVAAAFDEVVSQQYVRRRDVHRLLPQMTAADAVIWFGAGVVKALGALPYRSVGMTVSRGVVGDELFHHEHLGKLLAAPPLGGPGLIVLAGSNSLTSNTVHSDVLAYRMTALPYRPIVGIQGRVEPAQAAAAVTLLMQKLTAGGTLKSALAASEAKLGGAVWQTTLSGDAPATWRLPKPNGTFWPSPPSSVRVEMYLKMDSVCVDVSAVGGDCNIATFNNGKQPATAPAPIPHTKFICDGKVSGPYIDCVAKNPTTFADFWLRAVLTGRSEGDSVLVYAQGQPDARVKDIAVVGAGSIEATDEGGGATTITFGGPAAASTFVNAEGNCCIVQGPLLTGQQTTLLSKLKIKP